MTKRKPRRRSNGEGSTYQRADGQWCAALRVNGKPFVRYGRTRAEALLKLDQLRQEARLGLVQQRRSGSDLLTVQVWIDQLIADARAPSTKASHANAAKKIYPSLGHRPLHSVSPIEVQAWVRSLDCGPRIKQHAYDLLRRAFKRAVAQRRCEINPCEGTPRPEYHRQPIQPFTVEDVCRILAAFRSHRLAGFFSLIFLGGLRQGEALGVRWGDIDWAAKIMTIRQGIARNERGLPIARETKTRQSVREVPLTDTLLRALLSRALIAVQEGLHECDLIFPTRNGTPIQTSSFAFQVWKPMLKKLDIEPRGLHHGRHAAATFLRRSGVPLDAVAKLLGHSEATSSTVYTHTLTDDAHRAMASLEELIGYKVTTPEPTTPQFHKEKP